jgi:hypothetical protein
MLAADGWDNPACYFCAVGPPGAVGEWRWLWSDVGQLADVRGARLNARICRCEDSLHPQLACPDKRDHYLPACEVRVSWVFVIVRPSYEISISAWLRKPPDL